MMMIDMTTEEIAILFSDPNTALEDLNILVSGDYYFHNFLSSKVKLTDVGLYILESIKGDRETME
jgi:hypothetical protein